ncbi:MAG TPA: hypothetical protein PK052_02170 [Anaerohalosphaeraceae bacterium]|nr:hypothetical protein [Phycisphaerae bacterium]HOK94933.1 hypothetical protein [Anaerohalosphaeraceae bacterium]HOL30761.1 hypothetical protein [Anaerohalosphaeraceae bacterium]HOM75424.1 hypothetical protein [Anaerohalosphaeraceae bacterium]HPC63016.1 hypothetical protein [Anaerohalosphaeraceae bacterium]
MKLKLAAFTAGIGLVGFGSMFAVGWITKPAAHLPAAGAQTAGTGEQEKTSTMSSEAAVGIIQEALAGDPSRIKMTDQQLQTLTYEIREKIREYNSKLRNLETQEKRLQAAQESLKKDIEEMEQLRVELAAAAAALKEQQDRLMQSRLVIEQNEKENLTSIAAAYDKMDAESAARILMAMVKNPSAAAGADDAVKILYYMAERTKAKTLAAIAEAEPAVSVYICQRLKRLSAE